MSYYLLIKNLLYTLLLVYNSYYLYLALKTKGQKKIIKIIISLLFILLSITELIDHNLDLRHEQKTEDTYQKEERTNNQEEENKESDQEGDQKENNNTSAQEETAPKEVKNETPWENDPNGADY